MRWVYQKGEVPELLDIQKEFECSVTTAKANLDLLHWGSPGQLPLDSFSVCKGFENSLELGEVLAKFSERQREILMLRFGLDGGEALNRAEVGRILGISRQAVMVWERKAIQKLRKIYL